MSTSLPQTFAKLAASLLIHYSFDLSGYSATELIHRWQKLYPPDWLHLAVIEALYQGRYKGISVQQILAFWHRRGQAIYHFNMEFERLICSKFPESLTDSTAPALPFARQPIISQKTKSYHQEYQVTPALPDHVEHPQEINHSQSLQLINLPSPEAVNQEAAQPAERTLVASGVGVGVSTITPRFNSSAPPQPSPQPNSLPVSVNHPPIGQFTPSSSDRCESFTSKLKAFSGDHL
ncbi:hypothetical protein [Anabaena sp. CA = ATCC 33047]|uniref:hypothetical protein n=1 Tax=Anabaena sp. (strain CA / ATCC 33047) TaxID=52271 RepID=UPI00082A7B1C|nr:hypothetical protein [Anabaena sp. CA = ATCC 33047]